jgi:hypothetical protein
MSQQGYRRERTLYALKFEDPEFEGLEIKAKSLPMREFFELQKFQAEAESSPEAAEQVIRRMAEVLVSWNLEDEEGQPVPATYEGLADQDMSFVLPVFYAWMDAVASVPNRSRGTSNGSGTSVEGSIEMEPLSPSPGS